MKNAANVVVGTPDQTTTGPVFDAPLGTKLPTEVGAELDAAFKASGFISSDGLAITPDTSTNSVTEWSGATVKEWLSEFSCEIAWKEIQMDYEAACHAFGAENVHKTEADSTHGNRLAISIGARLPEPRVWAFKIKDGKNRMLVVVPNGQVTGVDEITFSADDAVGFAITLKTYPDAAGNNVYIYTDDGQVATA